MSDSATPRPAGRGFSRERLEQLPPKVIVDITFVLDRTIKALSRNHAKLVEQLPHAETPAAAEQLVAEWTTANAMVTQSADAEIARLIDGRPSTLN